MKITTDRTLKRFLEQKGLYDEFIRRASQYWEMKAFENPEANLPEVLKFSDISGAFRLNAKWKSIDAEYWEKHLKKKHEK